MDIQRAFHIARTLAIVVLALAMSRENVRAQTNYPGEKTSVSFSVQARVQMVTASNCYPYARGCLGVLSPWRVASTMPTVSWASDTSVYRGYGAYFPFTPCLLRLPRPKIDRQTVGQTSLTVTQYAPSPLSDMRPCVV